MSPLCYKFQELSCGQKINVVYSLGVDRWNGKEKLRGYFINYNNYI